jgi:hypothetical protein
MVGGDAGCGRWRRRRDRCGGRGRRGGGHNHCLRHRHDLLDAHDFGHDCRLRHRHDLLDAHDFGHDSCLRHWDNLLNAHDLSQHNRLRHRHDLLNAHDFGHHNRLRHRHDLLDAHRLRHIDRFHHRHDLLHLHRFGDIDRRVHGDHLAHGLGQPNGLCDGNDHLHGDGLGDIDGLGDVHDFGHSLDDRLGGSRICRGKVSRRTTRRLCIAGAGLLLDAGAGGYGRRQSRQGSQGETDCQQENTNNKTNHLRFTSPYRGRRQHRTRAGKGCQPT